MHGWSTYHSPKVLLHISQSFPRHLFQEGSYCFSGVSGPFAGLGFLLGCLLALSPGAAAACDSDVVCPLMGSVNVAMT